MYTSRKFAALRIAVLVAAVALFASACGDDDTDDAAGADSTTTLGATSADEEGASDPDDLVAAAEAEGSVTYYSDQNVPNLEALEKAFEAEYDIDLTFVRGLPTDLNPRVETELSIDRGEADVYTTADRRFAVTRSEAGDLTAPASGQVAELSDDLVPGDFVVTHASTVGFGWNTDLVDEPITSYEDLIRDDLKGLIGVPEPTAEALVDFYLYLEDQFGEELVEDLAALEPRVYSGGSAILEAMGSGEIAATVYASPIIQDSIDDGAPLAWDRVDPAWGVPFNTMILRTSPHPAAAQLLVDFMLTEAGQTAVGTNYVTTIDEELDGAIDSIDSISPSIAPTLMPDEVDAYRSKWQALFR